jgi:hypothetical protein
MTAVPALPPDVISYVNVYVSRARGRAMWRAAGLALSGFLAWVLLCCLADRLLQLSEWVRAGLLTVGLASVAILLYRPVRARLARQIDWLQAAAEVERHNPQFGQRLLTVTARLLGPAEHRGSDDLLYRLLSDVDREAAARAPVPPLSWRAAALPWAVVVCLVAAAAALARVQTLGLPRLALRLASPFADVDPVTTTRIRVTPGDTKVVQSTPLHVQADVERLPRGAVVWLEWQEQGGDRLRRVMPRDSAGGANRYALTLPGVDRDVRYRVSGGDYRSREFAVAVLRPPAVAEFRLRYAYPAYSERPPLTVANTDGLIEAPAGTEATLAITATEPLQSALLRIGGEKILMTRGPGDPENVRRATFKVARSGRYDLDLISTREIAGGGPPGMLVRALADRRPIVRLLNAGGSLRLNPRDILPLSYQALDDFGIESLVIRAQVAGGQTVERAVPREGDPRRSEGTCTFDLAELKLALGDLLTICLVATDRSGQQEVSEAVQVLVSPRSVDLETHQRITELEAAAQLARLAEEELQAAAKAFEESQAQKSASADASLAASGRGNRFISTATDTAVLARQSVLRAIVRSRSPELAGALAALVDSTQLLTAGAGELFRNNLLSDGEPGAVRESLRRLVERAGKVREALAELAQGERAAAILLDRENLAAAEKRGAAEPQNAAAVRETLQRAREDVAAGVKGLALDPAAPDLDAKLRAKVDAERRALTSQPPVDFAAAAREWALDVRRDPLRQLPLEDRLALAAQAEAVRPAADLGRARDLQLASRASARVAFGAASDKYAGRPVATAPLDQFAGAVAAIHREHELNLRPADVRPPDEVKAVRQGAAEARKLLAQWAGEPIPGTATAGAADPRPRVRRTEGTALRAGAELASRDYAAARGSDRELLRQLSEPGPAAAGATSGPATGEAATQQTPAYLRRDFDRVERLTDRAETIDRVQSDQERLAQETQSSAKQPAVPEAPALVDRQLDVAQRIEEVAAHDDPSTPEPAPSILSRNADDPNWRGRATAAVVKAQEQLASMPQYLTRAQEEAAALRQAVDRVEMARREAASAPADRRPALESAARQAELERQSAEQHFRAAAAPVAPAEAETLSARLEPFEPESTAARRVLGGELAGALRDFEQASLRNDAAAADRAAVAARQAIDAAQRELAAAQDEFTSRDPLVAAKWFARAAADSLTRSPPDFQSAYRRQMDTSQALGRAWDRTVHEAAAQRLSLLPTMQSLFGVAVPAPVLAGRRGGEQKVAGPVSDLASVREWGRLRTREVEELNAPLRETDAPGYEKALQLYFESLGKPAGDGAK